TLTSLPPEPLLLTWPCMTEAMYLLERAGGAEAQDELWGFLDDGLVVPHIPEVKEWERVRDLMKKYQDVPMDFADASLVVAAERLGLRRIFTLTVTSTSIGSTARMLLRWLPKNACRRGSFAGPNGRKPPAIIDQEANS